MTIIDLQRARTIIAGAFSHADANGFEPLAVLVLDAGGHVKAFERADGASMLRFEVAHAKAYGALGLGIGSRAMMARAEKQPTFVAAVNGAFGGALLPVPGGVLVHDGDELVGAVGVSGDNSDNDEAAAVAGIVAAGLLAMTG